MAPKKAAKKASADGDADDISCDILWRNYKKICAASSLDINKQIKTAYEQQWLEE
jgi:hypothetical protein